jgi:hypothetical protein
MSEHGGSNQGAPRGNSRDDITLASAAGVGNGTAYVWGGGRGCFSVHADTWGGGSAKLQRQLRTGEWIDVGTDTTLTADGHGGFELPRCPIRVVIATATGVSAWAEGTQVS